MDGVKPCPYCGGRVEIIMLPNYKGERKRQYRIECYQCRRLVARGQKFPIESKTAGDERIRQYKELLKGA